MNVDWFPGVHTTGLFIFLFSISGRGPFDPLGREGGSEEEGTLSDLSACEYLWRV